MPELTPLDDNRQEHFLNGEDLEPITRREHFYAGRESELPAGHQEPETREEWFIQKYRGGGGDVTVVPLSVTENGTYSEEGKAYSPVSVNVPLPQNAYLKKTATTSMSDAEQLPVASAVVSVTDKDKAELFLTSDGVVSEDNSPYTYRPSPSGKSCVDLSVVGGTVAWNQLGGNGRSVADKDVTNTFDSTTKVHSLSGTANENGGLWTERLDNYMANRVLYIKSTSANIKIFAVTSTNIYSDNNELIVKTTSGANYYGVLLESGKQYSYDTKYVVVDLTQAFGNTIADYVYSLESGTAGSGIAWLKANGFLTKDYYAYQSGKLESVNVASRKVYDSNDTLVATYPLDSDLTLRGIPKLDANNKLYYDGDIYKADGSVTRRFGVVDLGTLSWGGASDGRVYSASASLPDIKPITVSATVSNIICSNYTTVSARAVYDKTTDGSICVAGAGYGGDKSIGVYDSSLANKSALEVAQAMNGVYLVYELATSTTESAQPFINPQLAGSTEEFIDAGTSASTPTRDVDIPVGQDSKYVNGNIYIKYLDSVTTGDIELADENAIIPLENTTYISSNGSASIDYWSKEE